MLLSNIVELMKTMCNIYHSAVATKYYNSNLFSTYKNVLIPYQFSSNKKESLSITWLCFHLEYLSLECPKYSRSKV